MRRRRLGQRPRITVVEDADRPRITRAEVEKRALHLKTQAGITGRIDVPGTPANIFLEDCVTP